MMRIYVKRLVTCGFVVMASGYSMAYSNYAWKKHWLLVSATTPPNIMYVEDSQGRKTGTNPAGPLDQWGRGGTTFNEIPNSFVEEQNTTSDDAANLGQPKDATSWTVNIDDGGKQTYIIYLRGNKTGDDRIDIDAGPERALGLLGNQTWVFSRPDSLRKLTVEFDPEAKKLAVSRIVVPDNISDDIDVACGRGQISPAGICQSLKAKAEAARKDLERGNARAARGSLGSFLLELSAQTGKHVREPAATILREEAEALLKGISEEPGKHDVSPNEQSAVPVKPAKKWWWPF